MNIQECDILRTLSDEPFLSQRILAEVSGHSLGVVNRSVKNLTAAGYLDGEVHLTEQARALMDQRAPKNAVILAAGFGMRMVPINLSTPKALLEVNGERLIDRLIRQLHAVGVTDITVVVGFMKDQFEYLIDEYGVELVVNEAYATKNNIHSLALVLDRLSNTYIVPCDLWCDGNPFRRRELYSWYMVSDLVEQESGVRVNRKMELVRAAGAGNAMVGICYLLEPEAALVRQRLGALERGGRHDDAFWEEALYQKDRMILPARVVHGAEVFEINTYEQLRELDSDSNHLKSDAIGTIARVLGVSAAEVTDISVLKKGMTNRSFLFTVRGSKYIMRIPGEGTDQLIDRGQEAAVFAAIRGRGLCDDPVYLNPENGYKITAFLDGVRTCDAASEDDLKRCMAKLRDFHAMGIQVPHTFDLFGQITFYESLWEGTPSVYKDYVRTRENVFRLRDYIDGQEKDWCLTHIDAVCDNFLFYRRSGREELQLTDWEYAGMQDPHVDVAMFAIYSLYDRQQVDHLIDLYFEGSCPAAVRIKIYCYIAACGLLWSNWCEYKRKLGIEFGAYSLRQYRYAKDYFRLAMQAMEEQNGKGETSHD
ncbi:MAG: NTP transferase domain-containing protein [Oscillospiraceae bacterium]|nr:NTP transferase domain-containing protein [Oscillospiraceae bacterium]